jgi:hypothetical protein
MSRARFTLFNFDYDKLIEFSWQMQDIYHKTHKAPYRITEELILRYLNLYDSTAADILKIEGDFLK